MVLSLVLASCAPVVIEEKEETPPTTGVTPPTQAVVPAEKAGMMEVRLVKSDGTSVVKSVEKPKYGGELAVILWDRWPTGFDEVFTETSKCNTVRITNDVLFSGDWARGPAGTSEADWLYSGDPGLNIMVGFVGESWELENPTTIIFHVRKGVHFALNPKSEASRLVGGREMTADKDAFAEYIRQSKILSKYAGIKQLTAAK